jgi:hypothetical protein
VSEEEQKPSGDEQAPSGEEQAPSGRPWLPWVGGVFLAGVVLYFVVGLCLPSAYSFERSIVINASSVKIHAYVDDLQEWHKWQPWPEVDPTIAVTFGDKTVGVGANQTWTSRAGGGKLTYTSSSPEKGVEFDIEFGRYEAVCGVDYEPAGEGTKVTWRLAGDNGMDIIGRYFALIMDSTKGDMFAKGLQKLKDAVEQ